MSQYGSSNENLNNIRALYEGGHVEEAMFILKDFLIDNQEDGDAWNLLAMITNDPKEREFALDQVRRLGAGSQNPPTAPARRAGQGSNTESALKQALEHARSGRKKQANHIAEGIIRRNSKIPAAWFVKGLSAADIREYQESLHTLLELSKSNPDAQSYFERLKQNGFKEKRKSRIAPIWLAAGGIGVLAIFLIAAFVLGSRFSCENGDCETTTPDVADAVTCEELIAAAMNESHQQCQSIGTNEVCYGNYFLESGIDGSPEEFNNVGDVLGVNKLQYLRASPLDLVQNLWGVAVFKLQANLGDTIPGQNVTFLVFGNTEIGNQTGDMSVIYFSTGLGGIKCNDIEFDGLRIDTPDGMGIVFTVNGAEVTLAGNSNAVMSASPGGEMDVVLVSGGGAVSANGKTSQIMPGTFVSVPMNENLESIGQPSDAQELTGEQVSIVCQLYGVNCPPGTSSIFSVTPLTPVTVLLPTTPVVTTVVVTTEAVTTGSPIVTSTVAPIGSTTVPPATTTVPPATTTVPPATTTVPPATTTVPPATTTVAPPPGDCGLATLTGGTKGDFSFHNGNAFSMTLTSVNLTWPAINGTWTAVEFGQNNIIGTPNLPPVSGSITFGGDPNARTLAPGGSVTVFNDFGDSEANAGYSIELIFSNGCTLPASK